MVAKTLISLSHPRRVGLDAAPVTETKRERGKEFSNEEAKKLAQSWIMQSNLRTNQKEEIFLAGVDAACRRPRMSRTATALKSQWSLLNRKAQKYTHTRKRDLPINVSGVSYCECTASGDGGASVPLTPASNGRAPGHSSYCVSFSRPVVPPAPTSRSPLVGGTLLHGLAHTRAPRVPDARDDTSICSGFASACTAQHASDGYHRIFAHPGASSRRSCSNSAVYSVGVAMLRVGVRERGRYPAPSFRALCVAPPDWGHGVLA